MQTDAPVVHLLGLQMYRWGLFVAGGCLLAGVWLIFRSGKSAGHRSASALTCLLSPLFGLLLARLVYVLAEVQFRPYLTLGNALNVRMGGFSMYGALLGALLGGALAAKLAKVTVLEWMDVLAPALLLFVFLARLGEAGTALGISRPLVTGVLDDTALAIGDEYNAYLKTYLLESVTALMLFLGLLGCSQAQRNGAKLLTCGLLFGLTQTLFESLRYDGHLRYSFIGLQQLLSVILFGGILIFLAIRLLRLKTAKGLAILSLVLLIAVLAAILTLEFIIDRSSLNKWISYTLYVVVLALPAALGLVMLKRGGYNG